MARPSRASDQFILRMPDGMRDRIKAAADANNRSMNAEIVAMLEDAPALAEKLERCEEYVVSLRDSERRLTATVEHLSVERTEAVMKLAEAEIVKGLLEEERERRRTLEALLDRQAARFAGWRAAAEKLTVIVDSTGVETKWASALSALGEVTDKAGGKIQAVECFIVDLSKLSQADLEGEGSDREAYLLQRLLEFRKAILEDSTPR